MVRNFLQFKMCISTPYDPNLWVLILFTVVMIVVSTYKNMVMTNVHQGNATRPISLPGNLPTLLCDHRAVDNVSMFNKSRKGADVFTILFFNLSKLE